MGTELSKQSKIISPTSRAKKSGAKENKYDQHPLSRFQQLGNQTMIRFIQRYSLQPKIKVGEPGDIYEQEADQVADKVMRMPEPELSKLSETEETLQSSPLIGQIAPVMQRQQLPEEEEKLLQAQRNFHGEDEVLVSESTLETKINGIKGSGQPLPETMRNYFEPRFGYDFSQVRVHTDSGAAEAAQTVQAKAFTLGNDLVFGTGKYVPDNQEGKKLIAHELTHVIQQNGKFGRNIVSSAGHYAPGNDSGKRLFAHELPHMVQQTGTIGRSVQRKIEVNPGLTLDTMGYTVSKSGNVYTCPRIVKDTIWHELFTSLFFSPRIFKLAGTTNKQIDKNFRKHMAARYGILEFASKKRYTFGAGSAFKMNPDYWVVDSSGWSLKPGVDRREAINDLNVHPAKYSIACLAATMLTMEGGSNSSLTNDSGVTAGDWIPGDWGYITNTNFPSGGTPGLEGENIIYTGKDKFWGHFGAGNEYKTLIEWFDQVESWHGGASINDDRNRPDAGLE